MIIALKLQIVSQLFPIYTASSMWMIEYDKEQTFEIWYFDDLD